MEREIKKDIAHRSRTYTYHKGHITSTSQPGDSRLEVEIECHDLKNFKKIHRYRLLVPKTLFVIAVRHCQTLEEFYDVMVMEDCLHKPDAQKETDIAGAFKLINSIAEKFVENRSGIELLKVWSYINETYAKVEKLC